MGNSFIIAFINFTFNLIIAVTAYRTFIIITVITFKITMHSIADNPSRYFRMPNPTISYLTINLLIRVILVLILKLRSTVVSCKGLICNLVPRRLQLITLHSKL